MQRFIPFEKLSKKEKKRRYAERRGLWGPLSPVTRRSENPKVYKRQRVKRERADQE